MMLRYIRKLDMKLPKDWKVGWIIRYLVLYSGLSAILSLCNVLGVRRPNLLYEVLQMTM